MFPRGTLVRAARTCGHLRFRRRLGTPCDRNRCVDRGHCSCQRASRLARAAGVRVAACTAATAPVAAPAAAATARPTSTCSAPTRRRSRSSSSRTCNARTARASPATRSRSCANYIDTGKVRFASRDLPLPMHPLAVPAAVAARCAGEQGKYWEYREALFARRRRLPARRPYDDLARRFGLDRDALRVLPRRGRAGTACACRMPNSAEPERHHCDADVRDRPAWSTASSRAR